MVRARFDRESKFAVAGAFDAARELGHDHVGTEHLLIALARVAPAVFPVGQTATDVENRVLAYLGPQRRRARRGPGDQVQYTDRARSVIRRADQLAVGRGGGPVRAADLFQALLAEEGGIASLVLRDSDIMAEPVRTGGERRDWSDATTFISVTDDSAEPYYEQIAARVREAIAHGSLIPGDRLPPVRRLAESLDLAPGTVAKAYRQLEEAGVIETQGARGTVVCPPGPGDEATPEARVAELTALLRPVAVAAFHMGGTAEELQQALDRAQVGVFADHPDSID